MPFFKKAVSERQPKGLSFLFFTELWERFGFYTLQTIVILYMSSDLDISYETSYLLYGAFSSLIYLSPVLGGYIADRFISLRMSILLGALLLLIGYVMVAFSSLPLFLVGLSVIVVGNGLFKPNIPAMLGELYKEQDPRRDGGYTLLYMGINVGAFLPYLFADKFVEAVGWHMGFLLAAVSMLLGMIIFILGRPSLPDKKPKFLFKTKSKPLFGITFCLGLLVAIAVVNLLLKFPAKTDDNLVVASAFIMGLVIFFLLKQKNPERKKMLAALILIVVSVGFWAVYNQTYTTLLSFAETNMESSWLGFTFSSSASQYFNPFFIIFLSPILSKLWIHLDEKNLNPSTPLKFTLGALFMALGFFLLAIGVRFFGNAGLCSPGWLIGSFFLQTIGELLLTPVGLAMISELSPPNLVGMMMGVWFLTQFAAYAIGGGLARVANVVDVSAIQSIGIYSHAFFIYGGMSLILAIASFLLIPYLKGLIGYSKEV
jgi:POT family proton-dependent oligopeptide transporter